MDHTRQKNLVFAQEEYKRYYNTTICSIPTSNPVQIVYITRPLIAASSIGNGKRLAKTSYKKLMFKVMVSFATDSVQLNTLTEENKNSMPRCNLSDWIFESHEHLGHHRNGAAYLKIVSKRFGKFLCFFFFPFHSTFMSITLKNHQVQKENTALHKWMLCFILPYREVDHTISSQNEYLDQKPWILEVGAVR